MPYPGPWISGGLDERVRKTALIRSIFTCEHRGYWHIYRRGIEDAREYAAAHETDYLRFVSFWPSIMGGLAGDERLVALLER